MIQEYQSLLINPFKYTIFVKIRMEKGSKISDPHTKWLNLFCDQKNQLAQGMEVNEMLVKILYNIYHKDYWPASWYRDTMKSLKTVIHQSFFF
jgi:hypothetical protein